MGLVGKIKKEEITVEQVEYQDQLHLEELELLLLLVKQSTFKGEFVETVYNTTLKLQNQYIKQKQ